VGLLTLGLTLSCRKDDDGNLLPTGEQIGWAFGLCDAPAHEIGLNDAERLAFVSMEFAEVFGEAGLNFIVDVVHDQGAYLPYMKQGGDAFLEWARTKKPPLPPIA
jgi:hypothetical protein